MVVSLVSKNLDLYEKTVTGLTCAKAIQEGTQISTFRREDEAMLKLGIHLMIVDVLNFYGAAEKVRESDIQSLVSRILSNYWWMKLEEIAYVLNKGKEGHYGKLYGTISPKVISDWIKEYDVSERDYEAQTTNKRLQEETETKKLLTDDQLRAFYKNPNTDLDPLPDGSERMRQRTDGDYEKQKADYFRNRAIRGTDPGPEELPGGDGGEMQEGK